MGKIKDYCQDFLESGGYDLGYSMGYLPELSEFKTVLRNQIDAQDYSQSQLVDKEVHENPLGAGFAQKDNKN